MTDTTTLDPITVPRSHRRSASTSTTVEIVDVDEGVVLGRMFPFGEIAHIREADVDGTILDYDEHFLPGCTTWIRQQITKAGNARFLGLQLGHDDPSILDRLLGFGTAVEERSDGAYGTFQLYKKHPNYEHIREMLGTAWSGLSVSFADQAKPVVEMRDDRALVGRVQVRIQHIAAVPVPAYPSAGVVSIRASDIPDPGTPELDARIAELAVLRAECAARPIHRP